MHENHKYFEMTIGIVWNFFCFFYIIIIVLGWAWPNQLGQTQPGQVGPTGSQTNCPFFFTKLNTAQPFGLDPAQTRMVTGPT
jgi:hypothetical protein